jgi:glycosyltransferase involved in cell wall biosynthesis
MGVKVAFFTDTYYPQVNGLVTSIATSKAELERQGHTAEVYAPYLGACEDAPDVFRLAGFVYVPQPEYTFVLPWGRGFSLNRLRTRGIQVVHSHAMFGSGLVALMCAWRQRLPLLLTYHTMFEDYVHYFPYLPAKLVRWLNKGFTRWMCNRCALVVAPTPAVRDVLRSYGVRHRIEVLPSGLDVEVFTPSGSTKAEWGAAEGELLLSCAGRTGREKRMDLLIDALARIDAEIPPWKLVIAGDGPERKALERRIREKGLEAKVRILGYLPRSRVLDLMEASDLFAFPSVTETQGMVVLESMGRGTPVLGADAMGVGWMMRREGGVRGGWLAKPGDVDDFAAILKRVLLDPAERVKKAEEARSLAAEYSAAEITRVLAGFYRELAATA